MRKKTAATKSPSTRKPITEFEGLPAVVLRRHEDRRLRRGHLWVFSNEIDSAPEDLAPGSLVHFITGLREHLGIGYYHPRSLIAGRLLDRRPTEINAEFFAGRLRHALALRKALFSDDAYRWVFGESDDLPGLVIDRYGDVAVIESYAAGIDKLLPTVVEAVKQIQPWKALVLRNDAAARRLEGLEEEVKVIEGEIESPHWFSSEGLTLCADLLAGQKTGYFFDQRVNRAMTANLARGKSLLDVYSHTGGFGLAAAKAGAARVIGIDSSAKAIALGQLAAEKNGFGDKVNFQEADAVAYLTQHNETHDVVVLDPPRFAASKKNLPEAIKAYVRVNTLGMKRVKGGGFLATSSCSQHVDREEFRKIVSRAAYESGRRVKIIYQGGQGPDHPIRPAIPEADYLKFCLVHVH